MSEAPAVYEALLQAEQEGKIAALATVIRTQGSVPRQAGSKMLIWPDKTIVGTIGGGLMESQVVEEAQAVMRSGDTKMLIYRLSDLTQGDPGICGGTVEIFLEPIGFVPTVLVIGCGHVGKALAQLAKWSGFRVVVSDDRAELCTPEAIPDMDGYYPVAPTALLQQIEIGPRTFIAAVTRGLPVDIQLFPPLLQSQAAYIGLIGSKRRWALTEKALLEQGVSEEAVQRVHSPIGLDIAAETPQEIAVSIMAEIIQHYRGTNAR
ncbi:MAG: xanthine dehydrogenase [Chloroflexi bacterium]|nr:xanthine dehydrogenase [Chloroflexota bacterium]